MCDSRPTRDSWSVVRGRRIVSAGAPLRTKEPGSFAPVTAPVRVPLWGIVTRNNCHFFRSSLLRACAAGRRTRNSISTHGNAEGELQDPLSFLSSLSSHTRSAAPERDAEACWHALRAGMKGAAAEAATADA